MFLFGDDLHKIAAGNVGVIFLSTTTKSIRSTTSLLTSANVSKRLSRYREAAILGYFLITRGSLMGFSLVLGRTRDRRIRSVPNLRTILGYRTRIANAERRQIGICRRLA